MNRMFNITRSKNDPRVLQEGVSSLKNADRLGRALGWFSLGLGLTELLATRKITRMLGMRGQEDVVRAYGAREIASGIMSLSIDRTIGLWSRVAGDGLDIVALTKACCSANPKRGNVKLALGAILGITILDIIAAQNVQKLHQRKPDQPCDYRDRSGFPKGLAKTQAAVRKLFDQPNAQ